VINVPAVAADDHIDGLSELWYDDWPSYHRAFSEPRYLDIIRPDEHRFADLDRVLIVFAEDHAIFGGEGVPPFKFIRFLTRAKSVSAEDFGRVWQAYAAAAADDKVIRKTATAYIQNRAVPTSDNPFPLSRLFDGSDEFWLDRVEDIPDLLASERDIARRTGMDRVTAAESAIEVVTQTRIVPGFGPAKG
jgi:plasmid maintenance system antidote protein VapI